MGSKALHQSESAVLWRYRNREIRAADLAALRSLLAEHSEVGRKAFPRLVCEAWDWRQANGAWSECACRDLLLRLQERGDIVLPVRRQARPRRRQLPLLPIDLVPLIGLEVCDPQADLNQIEVRPIAAEERLGWRLFMARYHYLGYRPPIGERYRHPVYLAETFVDSTRFRGTCYRAANWLYLGQTAGRSKQGNTYLHTAAPKALYVYPLAGDARQRLCGSR